MDAAREFKDSRPGPHAHGGRGTVLVTGGAGYIGSHAAKALARAGWTPVVYDDLSHGHRDLVRWGPFEAGDIRDEARLAAVLARWRPVAALHFAALIVVGESVVEPARYWSVNVGGTLALLSALRAAGIGRLVFSSSCAVYGMPRSLPLDEEHGQAPVNPYGETKRVAEAMIADHVRAYDFGAVCLRYFNAAGADPEGETGERHEPETHLIPLALRAAAGGPPLKVLGVDWPTPDGSCVRDYVHVADLADAHVQALERLAGGGGSLAANLGTGRGHSVKEVIAAVGRVTGRAVPVITAPRRDGDAPALVAAAARARQELGWQPRWSELDATVAHAWAWMQADAMRARAAAAGQS